jgi:hypothetical protein
MKDSDREGVSAECLFANSRMSVCSLKRDFPGVTLKKGTFSCRQALPSV